MSVRIKAFLVHGLISIIIALLSMGLVYFIWYPAPLAVATGVMHIFVLMLCIDVVMGPLLTLLVYKTGKKTLKFDLTIICLLQLAALTYGLFTVYQGKPAWLVYNADRFDLVRINEIDLRKVGKALPEYQKVSFLFPNWVAAVPPMNVNERNAITFEAIFSGVDIAQRPELYVDLRQVKKQIQSHVVELKELEKYNSKIDVAKILVHYPEATGFVPLKANAVDMTVLINKDKGEVVKIVDLRPWK
jgi:hypothetical protein